MPERPGPPRTRTSRPRAAPAAAPLRFVYGPVPSRRLGWSLGVDILPQGAKTCTLDCIYCQLGPTGRTRIRRREFCPPAEILAQIRAALASGRRIDFITFSGSGEPTLNLSLGRLIRAIKRLTRVPVAVLTNATLLHRPDVRRELRLADLVVPSLDAATSAMLVKVNRPHPSLRLDRMLEGLRRFRAEFPGRLWLEIMLVAGINDSPAHIRALKAAAAGIRPDRIHLNTPVRPPAEPWARPLTRAALERIREELGDNAEIAADFAPAGAAAPPERPVPGMEESLLAMIRRRPITLDDAAAGLACHRNEVLKALERLLGAGRIRRIDHGGRAFYEPAQP